MRLVKLTKGEIDIVDLADLTRHKSARSSVSTPPKRQRVSAAKPERSASTTRKAGGDQKPGSVRDLGSESAVKKEVLSTDRQKVYNRAIQLLSMREHSVFELEQKLNSKFSELQAKNLVSAVINELVEAGLQSDDRFTESYVRSRQLRGVGPIKVQAELRAKGVGSALVEEYLNFEDGCWYDAATEQAHKKFGEGQAQDYTDWAKRARFLQGKGFAHEHIDHAVPRGCYADY